MTVLAQPVCAMTASRVALLSVAFKALLSCCGGVLEIQQECCGTLSVMSVGQCLLPTFCLQEVYLGVWSPLCFLV